MTGAAPAERPVGASAPAEWTVGAPAPAEWTVGAPAPAEWTVGASAPAEWTVGASAPYPPCGLAESIWRQARTRPDAVAVRQWDRELTYGDLVVEAAAVAERLAGLGIAAESRVAVCASRRPGMVAAVVGVLAAGAAYVPIDPAHPAWRRDLIIADAGVRVAVVDEVGRAALADSGLTLVDVAAAPAVDLAAVDLPAVASAAVSTAAPGGSSLDRAAYVLYTSGSTGAPKGVVVSVRGVVAFCAATAATCGVDERTRGIAFAALTFDVSVLDLFTVLTRGGVVCLIDDEDRADPERLQKFLVHHRVTWGYLPPALLPLLDPEPLTDLVELIVGGEATSPEQVRRWSRGRAFRNWYGPTEATVSVTGTRLDGSWSTPLPIGGPLPNHRCYVLDENLDPVRVGEVGELHVAGVGLARGYLNAPGLTARRFLPDPHADPHAPTSGQRMYATGDRVRWEPDGRLAFLGRQDGQVKVNGHRIEVGEVEAALGAHPMVAQSAVEVRRDPSGEARLIAYVTGAAAPGPDELREFAARRLPAYMVPSRFIRRDELPLTSSSKVDFAALARSEREAAADGAAAGVTVNGAAAGVTMNGAAAGVTADGTTAGEVAWPGDVHRIVAETWCHVLGVAQIGPDDDFVASGGTSLAAMRLSGLLSQRLDRAVSVADVFSAGTPRRLAETARAAETAETAEAAETAGARPAPAAPAPERVGDARLSAAQRRLWFVDRLAAGTPAYNIMIAQRLRGPLSVEALSSALTAATRRHAALRWRVPDRDGVAQVVVEAPVEVRLQPEDVPGDRLETVLDQEARRAFDLAAGPLWRARLLRVGPDEHVLALTVHHIVFDGWSLGVLLRDISRAYADPAALADDPRMGFADYVAWAAAAPAAADRDWWRGQLAGAPTVVDLPADRRRPPVSTFRGATAQRAAPPETAADLARFTRAHQVTGYAALLAAFGMLVRRLTGSDDIIIGAPVADRRHPAFDETVGFMVDTLPIRLRIDDTADFAGHARACHRAVLDAIEHRSAPFERIVDDLRAPRDLSRNPVVQVLFNMYSLIDADLQLPGIVAEEMTPGLPGSLFDLTLYAIERADGLTFQAVYNPDLYDAARIEAMLDAYLTLLAAFLSEPRRPVGAAAARPPGSSLPDRSRPLPPTVEVAPIADAVAARVRARPDAPAVEGVAGGLSHRELWALATALAAEIRRRGSGDSDQVAVLAARGVTLPGVLLGVLWSGARWLLLDPALPGRRLADLIRQSGAGLLVRCPGPAIPDELAGLPVLDVAEVDGSAGAPLSWRPSGFGRYTMTTSGSTGAPLIVECEERPLAGFLQWYAARYAITDQDATALLGGLAHDPLLRDAFATLVAGGRVCVPDPDWLRDPVRLAGFLSDRGVTIAHLTPALGRALAMTGATLPRVRLVVCGGDRLTTSDVAAIRRLAPHATLVNGYGTTETPQLQALHQLTGDEHAADLAAIPVGVGVNGAELHLAGPTGTPAAVGELGEVRIRGRNLAIGYARTSGPDDRPAREAFFVNTGTIDNPGASDNPGVPGVPGVPGDPGDRLFATGDLGRYDAAGRVVLAGRRDDQVKIRGFRVELGEIESALAAHPDVAAAAAATRPAGDDLAIYAYAVPRRAAVSTADLRAHLAATLPDYARPKEVILVTEIPTTRNGKIDRSALPVPVAPSGADHAEAATPLERQIAAIWREVLGQPRVSVTANFFDIGGHSLAVVAVQARIRRVLGRHIELVDLFRFPSIRAVAAYLAGDQRAPGLDRAERRLAAQRRRVPANRPALGPTRVTRSTHEHPDD